MFELTHDVNFVDLSKLAKIGVHLVFPWLMNIENYIKFSVNIKIAND